MHLNPFVSQGQWFNLESTKPINMFLDTVMKHLFGGMKQTLGSWLESCLGSSVDVVYGLNDF